jgi:hypothetical protein
MQDPSDLPTNPSFGDLPADQHTSHPAGTAEPSGAAAQDDDDDDFEDSSDNLQRAPAGLHEESLGERNEGNLKITYHVYKNDDQVCYYLERIYDQDGKMMRMVKRSADGRSETRFDAEGDIERIFESYTLPDGNHLSKEKRYLDYDNTTESVLVVSPSGVLLRAVVREAVGLVNVFQGQTEFAREGHATVTVNHWFDIKTNKMTMREQIQWLVGGERGVTEHFYFAEDGGLLNYRKVLYHPGSDRFLEEVHIYEAQSQKLRVKEIKSYERNAVLADMEVTIFDASGAVVEQAKNKVSRLQS